MNRIKILTKSVSASVSLLMQLSYRGKYLAGYLHNYCAFVYVFHLRLTE
jgi:hypothetical protein